MPAAKREPIELPMAVLQANAIVRCAHAPGVAPDDALIALKGAETLLEAALEDAGLA